MHIPVDWYVRSGAVIYSVTVSNQDHETVKTDKHDPNTRQTCGWKLSSKTSWSYLTGWSAEVTGGENLERWQCWNGTAGGPNCLKGGLRSLHHSRRANSGVGSIHSQHNLYSRNRTTDTASARSKLFYADWATLLMTWKQTSTEISLDSLSDPVTFEP